ncbi:MAG TPA: N-acetylmuramoyl-L-alanine amidase [Clostridiaceae bacterium]|nr:N-acetylmuramoyl-L-alanine amidase [Clostridiaceae bacterium]
MAHINNRFLKYIIIVAIIVCFIPLFTRDTEAKTKTIVIDPGHGGIDFGCSIGNLHEKDIVLDISRSLKKYLEDKGYKVLMTRSSDISLYKQSRNGNTIQRRDLDARVKMINNANADIFVSIHVNSYPSDTSVNGSIVFYFSDQYVQSKRLAQYIQKSLNSLSLNGNMRMQHKARGEDFYILRKTAISGVLVETAFITNPEERKCLTTNEYKNKIAESIAFGIEKYFNSKE